MQSGPVSVLGVRWESKPDSDFAVQRVLGAGSYGTVTLAVRAADAQAFFRGETVEQYAVKRFVNSSLEDASREVRNLKAVMDDGVCSESTSCYVSHFIGDPSRQFTIVQKYTKGRTLESLANENLRSRPPKKSSAIEFRLIVQSLLKGLFFMHSRNVVHRDIKANNIMVLNAGTVAVSCVYIDLGLSCVSKKDCLEQPLAVHEFKSPEFINAELSGVTLSLPKFKASDVWMLALMLYSFGTNQILYSSTYYQLVTPLLNKQATAVSEEAKRRVTKQLENVELAYKSDPKKISKELHAAQLRLFREDDTGVNEYARSGRAKAVSDDVLSNSLILEMLRLDWRVRLLPLVGIELIRKSAIKQSAEVSFPEKVAVPDDLAAKKTNPRAIPRPLFTPEQSQEY